VLLPDLGLANDDHPAVKAHILDPQAQTLYQAHASFTQQLSQQQHLPIQKTKQMQTSLPASTQSECAAFELAC
jgi:hypothetical protein